MAVDMQKLEALLGRVVGDVGGATSAVLVSVGDALGLYRVLARGPMTSAQLAGEAGVNERMVREWLLNQAASGYITYMGGGEGAGKYSLTPEQAMAFADAEGPAFMMGAFDIIQSLHRDYGKILEAFRSGKGLAWGAHDSCLFCGTERFFAASYRANLVGSWLASLEGVVSRLEAGARVADVGCGHGASTILMARAFPKSRFSGFDNHAPSIGCARARAEGAGLKNITFDVADATRFDAPSGGYDLVCCFDCLHDMGDPVHTAARAREALAKGGTWMVVEPAAGDTVEENLNPVSRVFSAASTAICVPASMHTNGPALGACAGPKRLIETIRAGGFEHVRIAARTPFNLILEARA